MVLVVLVVRNIQEQLVLVVKMVILVTSVTLITLVQAKAANMVVVVAEPHTDFLYTLLEAVAVGYESYGAMAHRFRITQYKNGIQLYTGILYSY
jgi:uncharacterized linocin/CFP29 family protein